MKIDVKCKSDSVLSLDELTDFQGNMKFRTVTDIDHITDSIKKFGFSFPFFVWKNEGKNYIIDGHGRLEALKGLAANGCEIPKLPVIYIKADSRDEAKSLLLRVNSLYGQIERDELIALIEEVGASAEELSFPDIELDICEPEDSDDEIYEPVLEPTIDTEEINDTDITKAEDKLADIKKEHAFVSFICRDCGEKIYVKRETITRYLRGEAV